MENNKCVEKYPSESNFYFYYLCSAYKRTNKEFYEVIQSYQPCTPSSSIYSLRYYPFSLDYSVKCIYGEYGCEKKRKNVRKQVMKLNADIFLQNISIKCVFSNIVDLSNNLHHATYETAENTKIKKYSYLSFSQI